MPTLFEELQYIIIIIMNTLQVATNGYVSLGRRVTHLQNPSLFNQSDINKYIVAPYLSDIDTRSSGSVSFEIYSNTTNLPLLHKVSNFIQQREFSSFVGTWMLIAEWNSVVDSGKRLGLINFTSYSIIES